MMCNFRAKHFVFFKKTKLQAQEPKKSYPKLLTICWFRTKNCVLKLLVMNQYEIETISNEMMLHILEKKKLKT